MFLGMLGFLGVIVFGIMSLISLFKRSGKAKRNFIITGVCFLLFIVGAVNSSDDSDTKDEPKENEDEAIEVTTEDKKDKSDDNKPNDDNKKENSEDKKAKEDKKKVEKDKKEEKKEKPKKDTKNIAEKIQKENDDVDKATIKDGVLRLESVGKTTFSENTLFHSVYDLFEATHEGFLDDSVKEVEVILTTTMVDQKGNESEEPVINYTYTRESFEELNYDKFSNMAFGQQWRVLNESDAYFIHPGIYINLKDKYTDNLSHGKSKVRSLE